MIQFDYRVAAHKALDALLDRYPAEIAREHAAESERLDRMRRTAGSTHLTTGDHTHAERHWPALSPFDVWQLIVRGSDALAGSVKAGYERRHGS